MEQSFLQSVCQQLVSDGWQHLQQYTLVFPMQRAELYFKQYLREEITRANYQQPVVLPRMLTIDQLVDEWSELRVVDEIRAVCQLYSIYKRYLPDNPIELDAFYGWGRQILNDFSGIDMALQPIRQVLANTAAAQQLDRILLDDEVRERLQQLVNIYSTDDHIQAFFLDLWNHLPVIYDAFNQQQSLLGLGTKGACYRWVVENFHSLLPQIEGRTFVFIGFNYLMPAEHRLMQLLFKANQARFFWDDNSDFHTDESVYKFIRQHVAEFGNDLRSPSSSQPNTAKPVTAIATMSANAQAQYVRTWLLEHHHQGERTAVIITDETMLEAVLYAIPDSFSDKANITKGYPMRNTSIFAQCIAYLSDIKHDRLSAENNYLGVLSRLSDALPRPTMPADTNNAPWQQLLEVESYCQCQLVLNRFRALTEENVLQDVTSLRVLRQLLRRALESISLPFHGEPVEEIQVIGVLETRLLDFDNLLILNVEEGVVPAHSTDSSFIPFDLRKAYGMQTHDEESKVYAYNFFRLLRRAKHVTMLFSEAAGDMSQKTMSRFLMQMLISNEFVVEKRRLVESVVLPMFQSVVINKTWLDCQRPDHTLSLSPSALADYIQCHRKFYLRHIERINEPEGLHLLLDNNELGTVFHGAIHHAYESIAGHPITCCTNISADQIQAYLAHDKWQQHSDDAIRAGFEELKHYDFLQHTAETEIVRTMLYNVLQYDATHVHNLRLLGLEQRQVVSLPLPDYQVTVCVGGVVDRIDMVTEQSENGAGSCDYVRIVDYKTGNYHAELMSVNSCEKITDSYQYRYILQTFMYCLATQPLLKQQGYDDIPICPTLLYVQRLSADKQIHIGANPVTDFAAYQSDFVNELTKAVKALASDSEFAQLDENDCEKTICPFRMLCGRENIK